MGIGYIDLRDGLRPHKPEGLSICYQYYEDLRSLDNLISVVSSYSEELRKKITIAIVDDHSKLHPITDKIDELNSLGCFDVYRILHDKPWNNPGARNLNALKAKTEWSIFTDMDHYFSESSLQKINSYLVSRSLNPANVYQFCRVGRSGEEVPIHINTYLINTNMYRKIGGVDEDFSGSYGCDDKFFKAELEIAGIHTETMQDCCVSVAVWKSGNQEQSLYRDPDVNRNLLKIKLEKQYFRSYLACRFEYEELS